MKLTMRRCCADDLAVLREMSVATFTAAFGHLNTPKNMAVYCKQAFDEESLGQQLANPAASFWFLYADGMLAGYMKLNTGIAQTDIRDESALEIERIYVLAAFQKQGFGAYMIEQAAALAREMGKEYLWLGVWEHNIRAIRFYEAHGFSRCGAHVFFLGSDGQTDIIMRRNLPRMR